MNLLTGKISSYFPRHISSDWQSASWLFRSIRILPGNLPISEDKFVLFLSFKEELNAY